MAGQMKFIKYDLGSLKKGQIVVTLSGNAANVRFMDSSNFNAYKNGRCHQYVGGFSKQSPIKLGVLHGGHWYVAVDMFA